MKPTLQKVFEEFATAEDPFTYLTSSGSNLLLVYMYYVKPADLEAITYFLNWAAASNVADSVNHRDSLGWSALLIAAFRRASFGVWRLLVAQGADVNALLNDGKSSVLSKYLDYIKFNPEVVRLVLRAGFNVRSLELKNFVKITGDMSEVMMEPVLLMMKVG